MDKVSMPYLFPSQDIKQNVLLMCDDAINFKIYLESTSKAMAEREKKRGRRKYKKKSFLDEIKNIFHSF